MGRVYSAVHLQHYEFHVCTHRTTVSNEYISAPSESRALLLLTTLVANPFRMRILAVGDRRILTEVWPPSLPIVTVDRGIGREVAKLLLGGDVWHLQHRAAYDLNADSAKISDGLYLFRGLIKNSDRTVRPIHRANLRPALQEYIEAMTLRSNWNTF